MATSDNQPDLDRVTPLADWFRRVGLPTRSGRRLIANGEGPTICASAIISRGSRRAATTTPPKWKRPGLEAHSSAGPNFWGGEPWGQRPFAGIPHRVRDPHRPPTKG